MSRDDESSRRDNVRAAVADRIGESAIPAVRQQRAWGNALRLTPTPNYSTLAGGGSGGGSHTGRTRTPVPSPKASVRADPCCRGR